MNALELAETILIYSNYAGRHDAAMMLRKQHAEIETLKAMNAKLKEIIETSIDRHNAIARMK